MPYTRKGKCVYKQPTGEKVGCSDTVSKAKKYIQALYASEINEGLANTISPEELAKVEEYMAAFMDNKEEWIKNYGIDQANFVMYKTAVKKAKKEMEKKDKNIDENKLGVLRELIKDALKNPKKADLNKDGKLSDYEKKRGAALEKNLNEDNIGLADIEEMGYEAGVEAFEMVSNSMNFKNSPDFKAYKQGFFQGFIDESSAQGLYEEILTENKQEAADELQMIMDQLYELSDQAKMIFRNNFPGEYSRLDAYGALDFGTSSNRYDVTLESTLENLDMEDDDEGMMQEDLDLGHQDNEPGMLKGDLYKIGKYAMELYKMMDSLEGMGEVDFPHWWQSKITTAKNMISGAKHYLDFEMKQPQIDAMVGVATEEDVIDEGMSEEEFADAQESERLSKLSKSDQDKIKKMIKMIRAEKDSKKSLNEYTDNDFSGNALIAQTPQPGRDELEAFDDFFPNGVASRENAIASLQSHDKSGIKARMGRYAPMFVHVQYHDFQDAAGEKYRVHQKQFYNSNFKDKDPNFNPRVTKLSLTKLADPSNPSPQSQKDINMGSILVKTDEYIKDLKNLDITNRQS